MRSSIIIAIIIALVPAAVLASAPQKREFRPLKPNDGSTQQVDYEQVDSEGRELPTWDKADTRRGPESSLFPSK